MALPAKQKILLVESELCESRSSILQQFGYAVISISAEPQSIDQVAQICAAVIMVNPGQGNRAVAQARQIQAMQDVPLLFLVDDSAADDLCVLDSFPHAGLLSTAANPRFWQSALAAAIAQKKGALDDFIARFSTLYEQAPIGVALFDREGWLLDQNRANREIFGAARDANAPGYNIFQDPEFPLEDKETLHLGQTIKESFPFDFKQVKGKYANRPLPAETTWLNVIIVPIKDNADQISGYMVHSINISQRTLAETALRESEQRYRLLFENMQEGFVLLQVIADEHAQPLDLRITEINRAGLQIAGRSAADILGHSIRDFLPDVDGTLLNQYAAVVRGGTPVTLEFVLPNNQRHLRVMNFRSQPGHLAALFEDVTEMRSAEMALRQSESRFRSLFEQTHDGVTILDLEGRHIISNQRSAEMLGYSMEEINSITVYDTSAEGEKSQDVRDRLIAGESIPSFERLFRKKNGQIFPVEINVELVRDTHGAPLHIQSVYRDISQRKEAEAAIQRLLAEKELLMREVHHRIKNNMNTISGLLALQANMLYDREAIQALQDADSRVRSMMIIYDRLYRSENYAELNSAAYLSELLCEIVETMQIPTIQIELVHEIQEVHIPIELAFPLGIILNECISNAFKFAFVGKRKGHIWVQLEQVGNKFEVIVSNDGVDLAPEFDLETSTSFGVSLVRLLARQINAEVTVSRQNGTSFLFSIPAPIK
jgi:PAS domain S-box-containing protein